MEKLQKVLIVAKCIVNGINKDFVFTAEAVLIVAKCIVNWKLIPGKRIRK